MVWKVLLGVVPLVKEAWPDTWGQQGRTGCFNDLKRWKNVLFDGRLKQQQQHQAERGEDKDVRLNSGSSRDHEAADSAAGEGEGVGQELDLTATALDLVKSKYVWILFYLTFFI